MLQWADTEFIVAPMVELLPIDYNVAPSVAAHVGCAMTSHVSAVAGVAVGERASMLSDPNLGVALNLASKSQLRQLTTVAVVRVVFAHVRSCM